MKPTPKLIRRSTTASGGLLLLTACLGIYIALRAAGQPLWGMLSFEIVLFVTGFLAVLLGFGRFSPGFGMGSAVLGATALGAAVLGFVDAKSNLGATWAHAMVKPGAMLRIALGLVLIAAGAADVLRRDLRQIRRIILAALVLSPVGLAVVLAKLGLLGFLLNGAQGNAELIRVGAVFLLGIIGIALVSAGGHLLITAFLDASEDSPSDKVEAADG
jgi:uncharacterized membrane protein YozB (DUF420 family)